MNDTIERLQKATLRLSQEGSIKDRLADAYASHLRGIESGELPDELRADFDELNTAMQREVPLPRECAVRASVRKMSNQEAGHFAALVVCMFTALARLEASGHVSAQQQRAPRVSPSAPVVHLFAEA